MRQTPLSRAALLAVAALSSVAAGGCGGSSNSSGIDVSGLERELETVTRLEKLTEGYEFDMKASCQSEVDGLHFSCRVDATSRGTPVNSWTVIVTCRARGEAIAHRCVSDTGYALQ